VSCRCLRSAVSHWPAPRCATTRSPLNAALQPADVYAGTITIGGLIDRGDIHGAMQANKDLFGDITVATLNPDDLADTVWQLCTERTEAEAVINALAA